MSNGNDTKYDLNILKFFAWMTIYLIFGAKAVVYFVVSLDYQLVGRSSPPKDIVSWIYFAPYFHSVLGNTVAGFVCMIIAIALASSVKVIFSPREEG